MKKGIFIAVLFSSAWALAEPTFNNIDESEFESISKEFSANFSHNVVMGAEPLGDIFGFEVSFLAGSTPTPEINSISGGGSSSMPHAGVIMALSVPFGITGELLYVPKMKGDGVEFSQSSLGLKWSSNKDVLVLPFNLAFRLFMANSELDFTQQVPVPDTNVNYKNSQTGFQVLVSAAVPVVEPYLGVGWVQSKNTLKGSGGMFTFTGDADADNSLSSMQTIVGLNFYALMFSVGVEHCTSFGTSRTTGKFGFYF
jgi:hypothetical protein